MEIVKEKVELALENCPLVHNYKEQPLAYGTAGYRTKGHLLPPVASRVVFVALLRLWWCNKNNVNKKINGGSCLGIMVTASHNPAEDNGFKIVDFNGEMLDGNWEIWCTKAANASTADDLMKILTDCASHFDVDINEDNNKYGNFQLGRDTRDSGADIIKHMEATLKIVGCDYLYHDQLTTPQLHFLVKEANFNTSLPAEKGEFSLALYYDSLIQSFKKLCELCDLDIPQNPRKLAVDVANGVGFCGFKGLVEYSKNSGDDVLGKHFDFVLLNDKIEDPESLNHNCGADFAKVNNKPSDAMRAWCDEQSDDSYHLYCVDGDADRIVAFHNAKGTFSLIDGDRISILYAMFIGKCLKNNNDLFDIAIVQTGYANGASTNYVREHLKLPCYLSNTGIKHLHAIAKKHDIGVYFEANGHGTSLINLEKCKNAADSSNPDNAKLLEILKEMSCVLSQICGDAIGDLLMCELAVSFLQISFGEWLAAFSDFPSRLFKVTVKNPKIIVTDSANETIILQPEGMQKEIDAIVQSIKGDSGECVRAFARPSGTEPVVRIYCESSNTEMCETLAKKVEEVVLKFCN
ncbi:phosphoacetylglucosamine mutase [Angomonas deanei]|nr:phosphoacetylglucosamine mutase [Angomonas deanei]|eukprot:EPY30538.1 phosphoacetylglucosamine mutase [Angomonas deanei]